MLNNGTNRKLTKDVEVSTMMSMRDQKMSNKQIADRLGVSVVTVRKYIGKQPSDIPRDYKINNFEPVIDAPVPAKQVLDYKTFTKPSLRVVSTRSTLEGDTNKYIIDTSSSTIEVSGLMNGILDLPTLDSLIGELKEIRSIFNNISAQLGTKEVSQCIQ